MRNPHGLMDATIPAMNAYPKGRALAQLLTSLR